MRTGPTAGAGGPDSWQPPAGSLSHHCMRASRGLLLSHALQSYEREGEVIMEGGGGRKEGEEGMRAREGVRCCWEAQTVDLQDEKKV